MDDYVTCPCCRTEQHRDDASEERLGLLWATYRCEQCASEWTVKLSEEGGR